VTYRSTIAEAQAQGLCYLARQKGLPDIALLRTAVVQLHREPCGWCEYEPADLLTMLRDYHPMAREEADWWRLPGKARLAAIQMAQGETVAS
jgi:hypothetical protein